MNGKINLSSPVTQTAAAVKQLIAYQNHGQEPEEMPAFYRLTRDMVLVLGNKKDAYYTCTAAKCSCPGNQFRHNCKHMRKYFPETARPAATVTEPGSIRPTGGWIGPDGQRANGPVEA